VKLPANRSKGFKVAIRENVFIYETGRKVNTYDLIIPAGKGKTRAIMLAHAINKMLRESAK
jgi:hypothetical protein